MRIEHKGTALNIENCCSLLGYSRQSYYQGKRHDEEQSLREELVIQRVLVERKIQKRLGGRKLYFKLNTFMQEHEIKLGRDGFFTMLNRYNLLIRRRRRKSVTTMSNHCFRRYPNLIMEFVPIHPNHLWVSDITYIRIGNGFGYLSLITDAYSHKIVGFYLRRDLSAKGCIAALRMALKHNQIGNDMIHHSDRGIQYACPKYVKLLKGIRISMTQKGDPLENAIAERVNGILKQEFLEDHYTNFELANQAVQEAISIYNNHRPHNSINNYTPQQAHELSSINIKRLWKNYYKPKIKEVETKTI